MVMPNGYLIKAERDYLVFWEGIDRMLAGGPKDGGSFTSMVEEVTGGIRNIETKLQECVSSFEQKQGELTFRESLVNFFTQFIRSVAEKLEDAIKAFSEFVAAVGDYLSPGNPFAMLDKNNKWIETTKTMTAQASYLDGAYLRADSTWKGAIGERYPDLASRQSMAVATVISHVDSMTGFLKDYASKILNTWVSLAESIINYMIDQIEAASTFISANPLEWADIVPKVVSVAANLLKLGTKLAADMGRNFNDTDNLARSLNQGLADHTGLPGGAWPAAVIV